MIYIEYTEHGLAVSDFHYEKWLNQLKTHLKKTKSVITRVSTSIPITALRLAICRGEIDNTRIAFVYKDKVFQADKDGRIDNWPRGFADVDEDLSYSMLTCQYKGKYTVTR